jgi:hypothetical protein
MQPLSSLCGLRVCCEPHSIFRRHCHTAVKQNQHSQLALSEALHVPAQPCFFDRSIWHIHACYTIRSWKICTPACLTVSAASDPGQLTHDALYSKLCTTKGHVDKKVVDQMVRFFAAAIPLASQQLLSELYDLAKASPLSNTKDILRKDEGLLFNGAFVAGTPSRCATIYSVLTHILDIHMSLSSCAHSLSVPALCI